MITRLTAPQELTAAQKNRMFALMTAHYDGVDRGNFERDLSGKDWVILLEEGKEIIGFSTQKILEAEGVRAIFSGDTIIDRAHWGTQQLSRAFARHFFDHPDGTLYWFLISKGYKTYKYLPTFFAEFYPRHDRKTPDDMRALMDRLGERLYPGEYRRETGVIEYQSEKDRLKQELLDLSVRAGDPHYEFFIRANPGYRKGDDLACITRLTRANVRRGAERILFGRA